MPDPEKSIGSRLEYGDQNQGNSLEMAKVNWKKLAEEMARGRLNPEVARRLTADAEVLRSEVLPGLSDDDKKEFEAFVDGLSAYAEEQKSKPAE
ncbi:MAG: hypothetical protein ABIB97_01715 [Patescibacteria group bacterium]